MHSSLAPPTRKLAARSLKPLVRFLLIKETTKKMYQHISRSSCLLNTKPIES